MARRPPPFGPLDEGVPGQHEDLQTLFPFLHVRPEVLPAFLVCKDGWIVDWFPAPLPPSGDVVTDPSALLVLVEARLSAYHRG